MLLTVACVIDIFGDSLREERRGEDDILAIVHHLRYRSVTKRS